MDLSKIKFVVQNDHDFNDTKRDNLQLESEDGKYYLEGLLTIIPYWGEQSFHEDTGVDQELMDVAVYVTIETFAVDDVATEFDKNWKKAVEDDLEERIRRHLDDDELTKGTVI